MLPANLFRSKGIVSVLALGLTLTVSPAQAQEPDETPTEEEVSEPPGDDGAEAEPYGDGPADGPADGPGDVEVPADGPGDGEEQERGSAGQGDRAAAESLARVGKSLMALGQYADACPKLEQSVEAAPTGATSMLLAECQERLGKIASAWASYRQAAAMLAGSDEAAAEVARQRALRLEPQVPKLTISSAARLPGMEVWRDEVRFGPGVLGVPLAVDPGQIRVEVRAPGYEPWSTSVALKPSERVSVQVPMLVAHAPVERRPITTTVVPIRGGLFLAGVITAGAGIAGMATGAILGASAARDVNRAESDESLCGSDRACSPAGREVIDGAETKALASTLTLSIGALALVGGFVMVLVEPALSGGGGGEMAGDKASAARSVVVRPVVVPWAGPDGGGLRVEVRF